MHILVTGGCGYIGSILTPKLLDLGNQVTVADIQWFGNFLTKHENLKVIKADIRDVDNIPMEGVDAIIHLANISNDPCGDLNAKLAWEVNALATMGLVEKAIAHNVKQFIFASSGSVYGIKEEPSVTEDLSLVPISDYNKTKMISERVLLSYKDQIIVQCIRPATVCGYSPRMRLDVSVNMLTMQALANKRITVFGGNQTRPNIHIQDITDVFIHFLNLKDKAAGIFNAGFENISILDIAKRITEHVPAETIVTESNDPRSYRLNADKLLSTGFQQKYSVEMAIKEIIAAFKNGKLKDDEQNYNIKTMKKLGF
ncbi:MAG: SDR family oxidoreductase [Proteobacteria bacterium]|nr:SDR family oxidoreductase [Pseudomonadota bacterium]MBU1388902.1 SDR family oxidoreductase [Pseudomonadota bacterium]MBU1543454.1 SDR family oxidoreductase [Pseudomonadota bacterium]MBU2480775.1 SDR family oxidoreductase [Pseudomonadota bacterium]